jgi:hypothetical protein
MRSSVTLSSATTSAPIPVSRHSNMDIGFGVVISGGGSATYTVQHTFDNVFDSSVTPTWFDHVSVSGETTNMDGNYAAAIAAIRLNVTVYGSGTVTLTVLQGV